MELSLATRKAITRSQAVRYRGASKAGKTAILDSVCRVTGFNRDYARRWVRRSSPPDRLGSRSMTRLLLPRWRSAVATLNAPAGKRLAPMLGELVGVLRRFGERDIDDDTAKLWRACRRPPSTGVWRRRSRS